MYATELPRSGNARGATASPGHARNRWRAAVTVPAGTSIMRAAALAGGDIPKLCATDTLKAFGSCRVCLVEIEGRKGFPASCTTEVAAGMKVRTGSDALTTSSPRRARAVCLRTSDGHLRGQQPLRARNAGRRTRHRAVALRGGRTHRARYAHAEAHRRQQSVFPIRQRCLCIVCSRCVRACEDTQGTFALTIEGRGIESRVSASQQQPFLESECVSCGACVEACPTGALMEKSLLTAGSAAKGDRHHLRVLRRRLLAGRGDHRRRRLAHGAEPGRAREPGSRLREGTLRLRLRHARGSRHEADDPQDASPTTGAK